MFDIGVATSIAKKYQYSWQFTIKYCLENNITAIQFYLSQSSIPKILAGRTIAIKYLHLPAPLRNDLYPILDACNEYRDYYNSDRLIIHQSESLTLKKQIKTIRFFTKQGYKIGIENEGGINLKSYFKLIYACRHLDKNVFVVLDIHRFFHNHYLVYPNEIILDEMIRILKWCKQVGINIVLHIIDSKSLSAGREFWCPLFKGLIPYHEIFFYIRNKEIDIESIIFEFETENDTIMSIEALKNDITIFSKN
jgi:hypothetical protein